MARKERKASRGRLRAAQLQDARQVMLPSSADVCIIGGGAAGLTAAITAAQRGASVAVLECAPICGRTILATGNGRCNLVNTKLDPSLYNDPRFVADATGNSWLDDVRTFFFESGLVWEEESEGRCYPLSRQAASVRNVLIARARRTGALLAPARTTHKVKRDGKGFAVTFAEEWQGGEQATLRAACVVVATGGGVTSTCEGIGLISTPFEPMLCPLACEGLGLSELDGRRAQAQIALMRNGRKVTEQRGEVLFRAYGLSGIAVFNLSRFAQPGDNLVLDLLPGIDYRKALSLSEHTLDGLLDPVVAQALTNATGSVADAVSMAKNLRYSVLGATEIERAQVRRGGLQTKQFDSATLEATVAPGLFACGEALDVDGPCGGYNLAWAWKSGMVAGASAAERSRA